MTRKGQHQHGKMNFDYSLTRDLLGGGALDAPTFFAAPIFSTCHIQTIVCSGRVLKKKIGSKFLRYWGLNDVMSSHCHSVTMTMNFGFYKGFSKKVRDLTLTLTPACKNRRSYSYYILLFEQSWLTLWDGLPSTRSLGYILVRSYFNPRPAGVFGPTRPAGGGAGSAPV